MTWFRVGGAGVPISLKNGMNAVLNKKFGTSGQNYPPNGWPDDVNLLGPLPEGTASGSVAQITDGAKLVPIKAWNCSVKANIDGVSSVECIQTKKNLFDKTTITAESIIGHGTGVISTNVSYFVSDFIPVKAGMTVYFTGFNYWYQSYYDENQNLSEIVPANTAKATIPSGVSYLRVSGQNSNIDIAQLEIGESASSYEVGVEATVDSVSLGRTIYCGSAAVLSGSGVDNGKRIKLNTLSWMYNDTEYSYAYFDARYNQSDMTGNMNFACTEYVNKGNARSALENGEIGVYNKGNAIKRFVIRDDSCTTLQEFLTKIADYYLAYECTDSTDFTFQPFSDIPETPLGVSNWWNNTGDSEVVYRRDIDLALQAVSSSRGLMMASRTVTQLVGEESDPDQVNELVEDDETELKKSFDPYCERYEDIHDCEGGEQGLCDQCIHWITERIKHEQEGDNDAR